MLNKYDYLIVGSGLFGSIFAYEMTKIGKKCLVLESRDHIGGNCYTENKDNINIHKYGPHIFHTNNESTWNWINQFTKFHNYKHNVKIFFKDKIYSFPINLMTLYQLWGVKTPDEANKKLKSVSVTNDDTKNLEEWILSQVGEDIYNIFIKGYTTKQWNKDPKDLPSSIIKRLPIRLNFNDSYYFDSFQGIPIGGYTQIFEKLLNGIEVRLNTDYFLDKYNFDLIAKKVVFTGEIDRFFDYKFGKLEYRSLNLDTQRLDVNDFQGCAQVNYTDLDVPYTRITEHKHFENSDSEVTWITKEYPMDCRKDDIPYYPINDDENNKIYDQYKELSIQCPDIIFGGRLAEYKYYDMCQIIESALLRVKKELTMKVKLYGVEFEESDILIPGKHYQFMCERPSDINQHLPTLKRYGVECESIVEMGVRQGVSTWSFIESKPKKLTCYDINYEAFEPSEKYVNEVCKMYDIDFKFIKGNTLEVDIDKTDLLFIDTLHVYNQLIRELNKHHDKVNKWIILHDTTTFGYSDYGVDTPTDGKKGLINAIDDFLESNKNWKVKEIFENNNGLTVLEKIN